MVVMVVMAVMAVMAVMVEIDHRNDQLILNYGGH